MFKLTLLVMTLLMGPALGAPAFDGEAAGQVERVIDGDTVRVRVGLWIDQELSVAVRLDGIDAPELFRPKCAAEKALAREAKTFVQEFLAPGDVKLTHVRRGKYAGRVVARLSAHGEDLSEQLIEKGLAARGKKGDWCTS